MVDDVMKGNIGDGGIRLMRVCNCVAEELVTGGPVAVERQRGARHRAAATIHLSPIQLQLQLSCMLCFCRSGRLQFNSFALLTP